MSLEIRLYLFMEMSFLSYPLVTKPTPKTTLQAGDTSVNKLLHNRMTVETVYLVNLHLGDTDVQRFQEQAP